MGLPPEHQALQNRIETALQGLSAKLHGRQALYLTSMGRFWQGLRNPAAVPEDEKLGDVVLSSKPTDQVETWASMNLGADLPAKLEFAVAVNAYSGPSGHGYTLVAWVRLGGRTFRRTENFGGETFRAHDWKPMREPVEDTGKGE